MFYVVAALVALILAVYAAVFAFSHKPRPVHKHEQFFETTVADGSRVCIVAPGVGPVLEVYLD